MRNRTEIKVTLSLLRHGATPANREHRYLGKTDEALSEEGRAELLLKKKEIPAELLLVSPMLRCRQTAEVPFPGQGTGADPGVDRDGFWQIRGKELQGTKRRSRLSGVDRQRRDAAISGRGEQGSVPSADKPWICEGALVPACGKYHGKCHGDPGGSSRTRRHDHGALQFVFRGRLF